MAQHLFCRACGVVPFYRPRSNPDGWAVTVHCLEAGTVTGIEVKKEGRAAVRSLTCLLASLRQSARHAPEAVMLTKTSAPLC